MDVLFGISNVNQDPHIDVLNYLILFAKHYIAECKRLKNELFFYEYQVKLKNRIDIERFIYDIYYDKKELFCEKWDPVLQAL